MWSTTQDLTLRHNQMHSYCSIGHGATTVPGLLHWWPCPGWQSLLNMLKWHKWDQFKLQLWQVLYTSRIRLFVECLPGTAIAVVPTVELIRHDVLLLCSVLPLRQHLLSVSNNMWVILTDCWSHERSMRVCGLWQEEMPAPVCVAKAVFKWYAETEQQLHFTMSKVVGSDAFCTNVHMGRNHELWLECTEPNWTERLFHVTESCRGYTMVLTRLLQSWFDDASLTWPFKRTVHLICFPAAAVLQIQAWLLVHWWSLHGG